MVSQLCPSVRLQIYYHLNRIYLVCTRSSLGKKALQQERHARQACVRPSEGCCLTGRGAGLHLTGRSPPLTFYCSHHRRELPVHFFLTCDLITRSLNIELKVI